MDSPNASLPAASPTARKRSGKAAADPGAGRGVIGWREWVVLPGLLNLPIKAKIDTGARTSAIHAFNVTPIQVNGAPWIEFGVHPVQRQRQPAIRCRAEVLDQRMVTSSNGQKQLRYVIRTMAEIGSVRWAIELSLADRDQMGFRMLLGREALRRRFMIDPAGSFRLSKPKPARLQHSEDHAP